MNLADLYVRLRAEGIADVVGALREASGAFDALSQAARGTADQTALSAQAIRDAMGQIGLLGMSLFYGAMRAADLAAQEEMAVLRWRAYLGERAEDFFAAVRSEVERTRYFFGDFSTMLEALLPAHQLVREGMESFIPVMRMINEALITAGVSTDRTRYAWYALAKAAVEGNAEFLIEGSRFLQAQIVTGERAISILREMNKELGVQQNLRIILRALLASERPQWEDVQRVIESSGGSLRTFSNVLRETAQAIGRGALEVRASLSRVFTDILKWFQETGAAAGVGRWAMLAGLMGMLVGLPAVLGRISSLLGRLLGLGQQGRFVFLQLAASLALAGLVMEDVWASLQGKPSLFQFVWRAIGIEEEVRKLPDWVKLLLTTAIGYITQAFAFYALTHPGVLVKLGEAALVTLAFVIGLEPLWRLIPGYEQTIGQVVNKIPLALKAALAAAGFAILGWHLAGGVGALVGLTIGAVLTILWDITHKVQKPKGWGEAAGLPTESWTTQVQTEAQRQYVQQAVRTVAEGEWAKFGQQLEWAYLAQDERVWRTAWQDVAMRLKQLHSETQVQYGAAAATYAWLTAVQQTLAGIQDLGARLKAAETIIEAFQAPPEVAELVRWAAYEPEEAARMIAERAAQVTVNVNIAPGAVTVEGGSVLTEDVKEEIVNEALRAVEQGLRTALDEEVE